MFLATVVTCKWNILAASYYFVNRVVAQVLFIVLITVLKGDLSGALCCKTQVGDVEWLKVVLLLNIGLRHAVKPSKLD